jgi:hypothetical protein
MDEQGEQHGPLRSEAKSVSDPGEPDGPSTIFEPLEFLRKVKKFSKTRAAILNKLPLYDYSTAQLRQQGFMGAWSFNLAESTIAALPGTTYAGLKWLLFEQSTPQSTTEKLSELSAPLLIPFILTATAYIVGSLSVRREDLSKDKRKKASKVFLYLDGAYGFYPQLLMSCLVPFAISPGDWYSGGLPHLLWALPFWILSAWTFILYVFYLPEDLFGALGYRVQGLGDTRPSPPTARYRLAILVVVPLVGLTFRIVFGVVAVLVGALIQSVR